jgi:phospholipid-translocating ATPase
MGIILQEQRTKKIFFLLKGADTAIKKKVNKNGDMIVEEADNLARDGLRTLAFCYRMVELDEYKNWKAEYNQALVGGDEKHIEDVLAILESDMTYLGLTGVEDLLQVN